MAATLPNAPGLPFLVAMSCLRSGLAVAFQASLAGAFALGGAARPWEAAASAWLVTFAAAEVVNLALLVALARREGLRYRDLLNAGRGSGRGDLAWVGLALLVSGPLSMGPNLALGAWLWGDAQVGADLAFGPTWVPAAWAAVFVFPLVHAATELPTYFGYVMPRLRARTGSPWVAVLVCACALSAQHVFLPLLFDLRFVVWRLFMFLPFALWLGFVVHRRPATLPWLVGAHVLLDLPLPLMVLQRSLEAP